MMDQIDNNVENPIIESIDALGALLELTVISPPLEENNIYIRDNEGNIQQSYTSVWNESQANKIKKKILELLEKL